MKLYSFSTGMFLKWLNYSMNRNSYLLGNYRKNSILMGRELAWRFLLPVSLPLCPYNVRGLFQGEGRLTVDYVQHRPHPLISTSHSFLLPGMKMKSTSVPLPRMSLWCWRRYVGSRETVACVHAHLRYCSFKSEWEMGCSANHPCFSRMWTLPTWTKWN